MAAAAVPASALVGTAAAVAVGTEQPQGSPDWRSLDWVQTAAVGKQVATRLSPSRRSVMYKNDSPYWSRKLPFSLALLGSQFEYCS